MMRVEVRLFAVLRERAGVDRFDLELPDGASVADARNEVGRRYPMLAPLLPRVASAVNRTYTPANIQLHAGDELAFIPPVSGG